MVQKHCLLLLLKNISTHTVLCGNSTCEPKTSCSGRRGSREENHVGPYITQQHLRGASEPLLSAHEATDGG